MSFNCENCNKSYKTKRGLTSHKKRCSINESLLVEEKEPQNTEIATREDLKEKIHDTHNFLRNNGVGYGMNALKVFNLFYGLAMIETNNLYEHIELNPECKFSRLLDLSKNENYNIYNDIVRYQEMLISSKANRFVLYAIPRNITNKTISYIIQEVDYLIKAASKIKVQLAGKLYEYFVGRDKSAISEMGAYFTDRHIIEFIYNQVAKIDIVENDIHTMIDPFGGSGGFTIGYINHLINSHSTIDWNKNLQKVYHVDMNDDVIKYAGLEFMCLTNYPPNMQHNIKCANTFTYEFERKFHYIITNPPYGGDKNVKSAKVSAREMLQNHIRKEIEKLEDNKDDNRELIIRRANQLSSLKILDSIDKRKYDSSKTSVANSSAFIRDYANKYKLTGNDKEATSLILMMALLEDGGTAIGVLKEGVFFDKKYKGLRAHLLNNFNIKMIVSIPSDQFENTSTKTSIIRFDNKGSTKKIKFYNLIVEKYSDTMYAEDKNGNLYISEMKDTIKGCKKSLLSVATKEEILSTEECSLLGSEYVKEEIKALDGYIFIELDKLCEFLPKSNRAASFGSSKGDFPFYTSGKNIKYSDVADYKKLCIIIGTGGNSSIYISDSFSCSADNAIMKFHAENMTYYVYNYLKDNFDRLIRAEMIGTTIKHVSMKKLKRTKIMIPENKESMKDAFRVAQSLYTKKDT
jgi:type I restriction-modification system DNA methylase subunit